MLEQNDNSYDKESFDENIASSSSTTSASGLSSRLVSSATLPRTSMKRPHSQTSMNYCSNNRQNSTIMDHFKSVRSARPRSRTMDNNIRSITKLSSNEEKQRHGEESFYEATSNGKTTGNSNKIQQQIYGELSDTSGTDEDGVVVDERIVNNKHKSKCNISHNSSKLPDNSKFGSLLAAFSNAKRLQSTSPSTSSASKELSITRPLTINVDNNSKAHSVVKNLPKTSISFPAQNYPHHHHQHYQQPGTSKLPSNTSNTGSLSVLSELDEDAQHGAHIPTNAEREQFQRSLDSAKALVFHRRNGIPLNSSPAPIRKSGTCFDFDSSLTSVNAIKKALFEKDNEPRHFIRSRQRARFSFSASPTSNALLGNFEESVLNGRLEPASIVHGFSAEIGASGSFVPPHRTLPVTVFFYTLYDTDKGDKLSGSPYLGHIALGPKGYHVPRTGTVQVTLFNPNGTVVKMFVVRYDLSDMPPNSRTFLRQRTLFMPNDATENDPESRKWLRYLIHLRFQSSKSGRIRLHTDLRVLVFQKHDLDVATLNGGAQMELRSFVQMPSNPKYSKNLKN